MDNCLPSGTMQDSRRVIILKLLLRLKDFRDMASFVGFLRSESRISNPAKQRPEGKANTEVGQTTRYLRPLRMQGILHEAVYTSRVSILNSKPVMKGRSAILIQQLKATVTNSFPPFM